jgi:hypothetical protein
MPDHVHLLAGLFADALPDVMRDWKRMTATSLLKNRRASGPIWQARYFDYIPRRVCDFWEKLQYMHRNPVESRLAAHPGDWKWSSANFYTKAGSVPIAVDEPYLPIDANAPLWPMHGKNLY